ncbi:hypothetical protein BDZ97DRAFT_1863133 [Flammula alnicola]|nr:hypothetical protein BDZ97DRAFT_1863133 [Flammula alnicola]
MFKPFKALLGLLVAVNIASFAAALDFTGAQWIWIPGRAADGITYPPGNATFRRDYYPEAGKTPLSANILITTDDAYTLYVNGYEIGTGVDFTKAQRYCVPLVPDCNVFAVEGQNYQYTGSNVGNAAGVLSAIEIRFTDGFTETIVTDGEWHGVSGVPAGFEQVAFDDSAWPAAFVEGPYPTTAPWNAPQNAITIPPATQNPGPSLPSASWIWTNEVDSAGNAPIGGRAFRKTVTLPAGQFVDTVTMDIVADNAYTLYINGLLVGSGQDFHTAQRYQVNFPPTSTVTIAVYAANDGGPAGLLAAAELEGCACGCAENTFIITDGNWKYSTGNSTGIPAGFENPGFDDAAWPAAIVEGPYGQAPWGQVATPTSNSPQSAAISGAPAAPPASVVA